MIVSEKSLGGKLENTLPKIGVVREITFREVVYEDGWREIIGVRAKCEGPGGEPISNREGAFAAIACYPGAKPQVQEFPGEIIALLTSPHWPEWALADQQSGTTFECEYLSEKTANESEQIRHRLEAHKNWCLG